MVSSIQIGGSSVRKKSRFHMPYTLVITRTAMFAVAFSSVVTRSRRAINGAELIWLRTTKVTKGGEVTLILKRRMMSRNIVSGHSNFFYHFVVSGSQVV